MQASLSRFVVAVGLGWLLFLGTAAEGAENGSPVKLFKSALDRSILALREQRYAEALIALDEASTIHLDGRLRCKYAKAYLGLKRAQEAERAFTECLDYLKKEDSKDLTDELRRELENDLQRARELQASHAAAALPAPAAKTAVTPVATIQTAVAVSPISPGVIASRLAKPAAEESPAVPMVPASGTPANDTEERMRVRAHRRIGWGIGLTLTGVLAVTAAGLGGTAYAQSHALADAGAPAYDDFRMQSQTIRSFALGADVALGAALLSAALTFAIVPNRPSWPKEQHRSVTAAPSREAELELQGPAATKLVATK